MQHRTIVGSSRRSYPLFMSDSGESTDQTLLEQMRKALGEKDDVFSEAEKDTPLVCSPSLSVVSIISIWRGNTDMI